MCALDLLHRDRRPVGTIRVEDRGRHARGGQGAGARVQIESMTEICRLDGDDGRRVYGCEDSYVRGVQHDASGIGYE